MEEIDRNLNQLPLYPFLTQDRSLDSRLVTLVIW
jgi:hypothetical protein